MGRSAWGEVGVESNRRVGWRKGFLERGEPGGGRVGRVAHRQPVGWGWKALRVPSKFVTKSGDSSGSEPLPKAGETVRERVVGLFTGSVDQ